MAIGDPFATQIPAVGTGGTAYATSISAFLTEVKTRLEAKVPVSSILASSLDLANNPLQNAQYVSYYPQAAAPTTPVGSISNFGGNMYWVSSAGAVQVTNGANLNAAGIGGITGDYGGANPAQLRFVDVDQEYYAYDDFGAGAWARFWARNFDVAAGATSAVRCRLAFGGAGSYTLTLPPAVPAGSKLLQMSNAGAVTASSTLPVDEHIVLSGTGTYKHGDKQLNVRFSHFDCVTRSGAAPSSNGTLQGCVVANNSEVFFPVHGIQQHWRVKQIVLRLGAVPAGSVRYNFVKAQCFAGVETFTKLDSPGAGDIDSALSSVTMTPSGAFAAGITLNTTEMLWVGINGTLGAIVGCTPCHMEVTYDIP